MAKSDKKNKTISIKAQDLSIRRFLAGLMLVCLVVTIIGSALAGAQVITIIYRCFAVYAILFVFSSIIRRYWISICQIRQENAKEH